MRSPADSALNSASSFAVLAAPASTSATRPAASCKYWERWSCRSLKDIWLTLQYGFAQPDGLPLEFCQLLCGCGRARLHLRHPPSGLLRHWGHSAYTELAEVSLMSRPISAQPGEHCLEVCQLFCSVRRARLYLCDPLGGLLQHQGQLLLNAKHPGARLCQLCFCQLPSCIGDRCHLCRPPRHPPAAFAVL